MTNEFDKGREFEILKRSIRFKLWLGYGSLAYLIMIILAFIFTPDHYLLGGIYTLIILALFSLASLYLGYYEKKELKKYDILPLPKGRGILKN